MSVAFWADMIAKLTHGKAPMTMPAFDGTLVIVMGISHGAYLGLKTTE